MKKVKQNNPVAKHARTFNKAQTMRDRTKYTRKGKNKGPFVPNYL